MQILWVLILGNVMSGFGPSVAGFITSACLGKHEEFTLCARRCQVTCVNRHYPQTTTFACHSMWECSVGCTCSSGYIRDMYKDECVTPSECPDIKACPKDKIMDLNKQCVKNPWEPEYPNVDLYQVDETEEDIESKKDEEDSIDVDEYEE